MHDLNSKPLNYFTIVNNKSKDGKILNKMKWIALKDETHKRK